MQQTQLHGEPAEPTCIRMSSAGRCRRQTGYEVLGYPESDPTPTEGMNVLEMGDWAEVVLIRRLREQGWEVDFTRWDGGEQLEVRLEDPPRLGHPDGRCRHTELTSNGWVLLECKGMNSHQYRRFLQDGFTQSHPQYLDQVAQYGVALHQQGLVASPTAAVVAALDRDTGRWSYQRVRWEMEVYHQRTQALAQGWESISRGELPERDHDGSTWHCSPRYCRWSSLCWEGKRLAPELPSTGDGVLQVEALEEGKKLRDLVEVWREGKDLEARGKAMQEEAREVFQEVLSSHGSRKLVVDGLTASVVSTSRRAWDEKALRQFLTEDQLLQAQKVTESTSLRVVDNGQGTEA